MRFTPHARRLQVGRAVVLCLAVCGDRASDCVAPPRSRTRQAPWVTGCPPRCGRPRSRVSRDRHAIVGRAATALPEDDSLRGRSGKLRAVLVPRSDRRAGVLERLFGDSLLRTPGVHAVRDSGAGTELRPDHDARLRREARRQASARTASGSGPASADASCRRAYAQPGGVHRGHPREPDTYVSEHFRLRDFLTHDQQDVWPKYLVLRAPLVDKLELVIAQLEARGTPSART